MLAYLGRRLLTATLTVLGVATFVFALIHLLPGDPAETMLARSGAAPAAVAALRAELGLDLPLATQYASWLAAITRGDLGRSLFSNRPVSELIREQFPHTAELAAAAFIWALALGIGLGCLAARWLGRWPDRVAMIAAIGGVTVPVFWSGLLLIWLFSVQLRWLPPAGADDVRGLVLPALALGYASAGPIARLTRATLADILARPYITMAKAKGLSPGQILFRHTLRNVLGPLLTIAGLQFSFLIGGTVVTETVFSRPGMGRLLIDAILWRDLPLVQGLVLLVATLYVAVNFLVDIAAAWCDPQIGWR